MIDAARVREWYRAFRRVTPRVRRHLETLVQYETPSSDKAAVDRCVDMLAAAWQPLVAALDRIPQTEVGDFLYARVPGRDPDAAPVLVLCHLDTVWPVGTLRDWPLAERDGRLCGPGVVDMKGGLALVWAWLEWARSEAFVPPRPVDLLVTTDEEIGSHHGRPWIERYARAAHHVVVPEPPGPGGALKIRRKGVATYRYRFRGRAAHAGVEPWEGASAVLEAARAVLWLHGLNPPDWHSSVIVGRVQGGTRVNVVPEHCVVEVDVRYGSRADRERLKPRLQNYQPADPRVTVTIECVHERPPMEPSPETLAYVEDLTAAMQAVGYTLTTVASGGGSDGNFTAAMGIPTLDGMGPEGGRPHAREEYVELRTLAERLTLLHLALIR